MNDYLNPFIAGAPVLETSMFFGREEVFKWIENSLAGKYVNHILVLHGQRRVGKTTVLKQIPNFFPSEYIQIFFDLQGRTNTTLDRFLWWMGSEIVRTLNKRKAAGLSRPDRNSFVDPNTFITDFIPIIQNSLDGSTLLLTFDEFDTLTRPDIQEHLSQPLIAFLRRLFDIESLNFIFSIGSSGNKLENMQASYTDFFKTALYRKVSFLTEKDCYDLITKPVEDVIAYQPDAIDRIIEITSGHPYFTQLTCHELFSLCQKNETWEITVDDVNSILDDVIERGTVNLKFVWDEASDLEKWTLASLAQMEGASLKKISQELTSQSVRFTEPNLNSALLHLRDKDVLTRDNHFIIFLMKKWLQTNRPKDRVREELVQINPIANRYIEIGDEYRDREQYAEALDSYQQALTAQPNNIFALINIANIHLEQQNYQQAAASFEKALGIDAEHIAAQQGYCQSMLALGDLAKQNDELTEAIGFYQSILNINPVHAQARQILANIFRDQAEAQLAAGSDSEAVSSLNRALEMTPEDEALRAQHQQIIDAKKYALVKSLLDKAERALRRKRWEEAAAMAQEALNVDPGDETISVRLAEIKDAPRQERLKAYRLEAQTSLDKGEFTPAIDALQMATQLAPEDKDLSAWLEIIKTDQHQSLLDALRDQAAIARQNKRWEEAIAAIESLLELAPEDKQSWALLKECKQNQRRERLDDLLREAESSARMEKWADANHAWQTYLEEVPEDKEKLEDRITKATKFAKLSADYRAAQELIKKRQFNKAINILQGIIAQDPTYKSTSRLLAEAVEADRQKKPFYRDWRFITALGVVVIAAAGFLFRDQLFSLFSPAEDQAGISETEVKETIQSNQIATEYIHTTEEYLSLTPTTTETTLSASSAFSLNDIATYSDIHNPSLIYNFADPGQDWGMYTTLEGEEESEQGALQDLVEGGLLNIPAGELGFNLPVNTSDFILRLTFSPQADFDTFLIDFRNSISDSTNYYMGLHNGGSNYNIGIEVNGQTRNLDEGVFDLSSDFHTIEVVAQGNTLIVFWNYELLYYSEEASLQGSNISFYFSGDGTNNTLIQLSSIDFWNLEGIDIKTTISETKSAAYETIMPFANSQQPTMQDDFSGPYYTFEENKAEAKFDNFEELIQDEQLSFHDFSGQLGFYSISSDHTDFMLQFDVSPQEAFGSLLINFNPNDEPDNNFHSFALFKMDEFFYLGMWNNCEEYDKPGYELGFTPIGELDLNTIYQILIIAKDDEIFIFWDGELVINKAYSAVGSNHSWYVTSLSESGDVLYIDNVRYWNLDGIEFNIPEAGSSTTPTGTPAPAWVTNFAEPILVAIQDYEPYFYDDFGPDTEGWVQIMGMTSPFSIGQGFLRMEINTTADNIFLRNMPNFVLQVIINRPINGFFLVSLSGDNEITFSHDGVSGDMGSKEFSFGAKIQFTIIIRGDRAGLYLDGSPVFYYVSPGLDDIGEFGNFGFGCHDSFCTIDEVKFWNLNRIPELP